MQTIKTSLLTDELREDFFIRVYFNTKDGFHQAGIKRAYLDFCRTLAIKNNKRHELRRKAESYLLNCLKKVTEKQLRDQADFDNFHKESCEGLIRSWDELSFGQAQKWINMVLKYWLLLGEKRITGIEKNARYFHIPIDRFVQEGMYSENNAKPWSKIESYEDYFDYQIKHRQKNTGNPPIVDEFLFYNEYKP